jgi:hypothetical protein
MDDMAAEMLEKMAPQLIVAGVYTGGFDRMLNPMTNLGDLVMRSSEVRVVRLVEGGLVRSSMYDPTMVDIDLWLKTHWYSGAWLFDGAYVVLDAVRNLLRGDASDAGDGGAAPATPPGVAEGLAALGRLQQRARAAGVPLVVLLVSSFGHDPNAHGQERLIAAELARFCAATGIPVLDPTRALQVSGVPLQVRPTDYHWSSAANAVVARELASFLRAQHLVPGVPGGAVAGRRQTARAPLPAAAMRG